MTKNYMIKKVLAITLVFSMLLLQTQTAFANNGVTDSALSSEEQLLCELGIIPSADSVSEKNVSMNGTEKVCRTLRFGEIYNDIIVLENSTEKTVLDITQGDIHNVLEFNANGDVILDGNPVEVTYAQTAPSTDMSAISPRAGATIYYKDAPEYGLKSDYTHFLKNQNVADIKLNEKISSMACSAFISIIVFYVSSSVYAAAVAGAITELSDVYNDFIHADPDTTGLSCKAKVYTHKNYTSGYIPSIFTFIYKYSCTFYSKTIYQGTTSSTTIYMHNMQG